MGILIYRFILQYGTYQLHKIAISCKKKCLTETKGFILDTCTNCSCKLAFSCELNYSFVLSPSLFWTNVQHLTYIDEFLIDLVTQDTII